MGDVVIVKFNPSNYIIPIQLEEDLDSFKIRDLDLSDFPLELHELAAFEGSGRKSAAMFEPKINKESLSF